MKNVAKTFLFLIALILAGCANVKPRMLQGDEVTSQARKDREAAHDKVDPIRGPVSLEEAIARAIKYNLDRRTRMYEEAVALRQLDLSQYDMLPKVMLEAGYNGRSEYATTRAIDSVTGSPSLANPAINSDKNHRTADLGLSWSVLDFGLSYYTARQNADRVLVAAERRRRAMHLLIQDVRTAFWRAAGAQKLRQSVRDAIDLAEDALADARKIEGERVRSPLDSLRYQRQVLENVRLLESIDQDLSTAKLELIHLMNAPLAYDLKIEEPSESLNRRLMDISVQEMEETAVLHNAELREQFYGTKIASDEARKVMLRMFPNLTFGLSLKYDDDRFLVHSRWNEAASQISWSLLNVMSIPAQKRFAEAGVALADQRRIATQMAVLAQVHIARLQYANSYQQFVRADAIFNVDERINRIVVAGERAQTQSKLDRVSSHTTTILSQLRRYQALAQVHASASKLQATLGIEPMVPDVQGTPLPEMIKVAREFLRQTQGDVPAAPQAPKRSSADDELPVLAQVPRTQDRPITGNGIHLRLDDELGVSRHRRFLAWNGLGGEGD